MRRQILPEIGSKRFLPLGMPVSRFVVVRQMPQEDGEVDFRYRIKNEQETFERNVFEYDLTASDKPAELYGVVARMHRAKHH